MELAAKYGPVPFGIVLGIMLDRWSMRYYFKSTEEEKKALRGQIKDLHVVVRSKEDRIERLHDQITERKSGGNK